MTVARLRKKMQLATGPVPHYNRPYAPLVLALRSIGSSVPYSILRQDQPQESDLGICDGLVELLNNSLERAAKLL